MELYEFLKPMDGPHRRSAILRIADCCGVSRRTVKRWFDDRSIKIKDLYKREINEEFNRQIFVV